MAPDPSLYDLMNLMHEDNRSRLSRIEGNQERQTNSIDALERRVTDQMAAVAAHLTQQKLDTQALGARVVSLEDSRKIGRWLTGTAITSALAAVMAWLTGKH
jgi:hypothetical protein